MYSIRCLISHTHTHVLCNLSLSIFTAARKTLRDLCWLQEVALASSSGLSFASRTHSVQELLRVWTRIHDICACLDPKLEDEEEEEEGTVAGKPGAAAAAAAVAVILLREPVACSIFLPANTIEPA